MQLCIFEDNNALNFEPLSFYRPVFELVCGINTLREKILRYFPGIPHSILCREYLAGIVMEREPQLRVNQIVEDDYLFINGSILADDGFKEQIYTSGREEVIFVQDGVLIAAKISGKRAFTLEIKGNSLPSISMFEGIKIVNVSVRLLRYTFDMLKHNHNELLVDSAYHLKERKSIRDKYPGVHLIGEDLIKIDEGTILKPGVVLDASEGPVIIGKNVVIFPNSVIEGPVSIGDSSFIKSCSTIYSNVSIGKVCKVGGEVEDLIMLDFSNKQHAGFIGHSYLGSWINLGADTNCSDLKNNYSPVKINLSIGAVDTGMQFLGLLMGDHTKSAINTMFNTGTVAGFSSNIFGAGFPDKYIPSFSWGGSEGFIEYEFEKSVGTARIVFGRRKVPFTDTQENLFRNIFMLSRSERLSKEIIK